MTEESGDNGFQHVSYSGPTHDTHSITVPRPKQDESHDAPPVDNTPQPSLKFTPSTPPQNEEPPHIEIPKIRPMSTGESPRELAKGLEGKYVDEFGNILDWDGTVLGRVEGDLPSMVGRPVEESGEILDADGEVAGHVSENYSRPPLKPLQGGLKVDEEGNIYNDEGQVIGRLNSPPPGSGKSLQQNAHNTQSAHDDPKPSPATPSPSEVYLDIKSTHDGIQLIIKIPTVFNRDPEKRQ